MIHSEHLTLACCLFTLSKENFVFPMLSFLFTGKTLVAVCGSCYPSVVLKQQKNPWLVSMTVLEASPSLPTVFSSSLHRSVSQPKVLVLNECYHCCHLCGQNGWTAAV
jgi:hypothetical protein